MDDLLRVHYCQHASGCKLNGIDKTCSGIKGSTIAVLVKALMTDYRLGERPPELLGALTRRVTRMRACVVFNYP